MKFFAAFCIVIFSQSIVYAQSDSLLTKKWMRDKISFGRSQHIQYLNNNKIYKTNTLFNKSYYASFSPVQFKGFKPFLSLSYEYFITRAVCYTCVENTAISMKEKKMHFINLATLGFGFMQTFQFKNKAGKAFEFIAGASVERILFKRAFIYHENLSAERYTPFQNTHSFFNQYFFKDLYGVRVYNAIHYKVFIQVSGVLLRNERLRYIPSRHTFHNFMLGFNVFLK